MTDRTAYRQRVATVRGRARAQLAAIRKERLARMRTGCETTDPLAAAWVADQLSDAAGTTDAPEYAPKLALVTPAHDEESEAGDGAEAAAAEFGATQAEDGEADLPSGTVSRQQEAVTTDDGATDADPGKAMTAPPDDPVDLALVGAPPPTMPLADTEPAAADAPAAACDEALAPDVPDVRTGYSPGPQEGTPATQWDEPPPLPEPPVPADDVPSLAGAVALHLPHRRSRAFGFARPCFHLGLHDPLSREGQHLTHEVAVGLQLNQFDQRHSLFGHRRLRYRFQVSQPEPSPKIGDDRQRRPRPRAALRRRLRARPPTPPPGTLPLALLGSGCAVSTLVHRPQLSVAPAVSPPCRLSHPMPAISEVFQRAASPTV
jgi:hypothetical protein